MIPVMYFYVKYIDPPQERSGQSVPAVELISLKNSELTQCSKGLLSELQFTKVKNNNFDETLTYSFSRSKHFPKHYSVILASIA